MATDNTDEKTQFTLYLPADLAKRLELAAAGRNRSAAEVAVELLNRHLPRPGTRKTAKKKSIPYT